ncbi:MAG: hypothetical protein ABIU77_16700 [Ferruginibacter sp.]
MKLTDPVEIRFRNTWTGNVSNAWENPANWSCGEVPDNNTDVVINGGTVSINSNIIVGSLSINEKATVSVTSAFTIIINRCHSCDRFECVANCR